MPDGWDRLAVPTPFAVGPVNCWLLHDEPLTLVDCGPNSGAALDALETALGVLGHRVEDLGRILITHQHVDHEGLAAILARRSGAEVCALDLLAPVLEDHAAHADRDDELMASLMRRHGFEHDLVTALHATARGLRGWGAPVGVDRRLADGDALSFAGRMLRVHHRPGHSPSDTVFHDVQARTLIGGDHLLGHISSNPILSLPLGGKSGDPAAGRPRPLLRYLDSLAETRAMADVGVVLGGHGDPVTDAAGLIDARLALHDRRAAKIVALLRDDGPLSAHAVARRLWSETALTQPLLTLSEAIGHLDLLASRGEVSELDDGAVSRWRAA